MMLVPPLVSFDRIGRADLNRCLVLWQHKMGAWTRAEGYPEWFHGLRHHGELVAVTAAGALIKEPVAGFSRAQAFELGRVCAARPHLCRAVLRLWREFVFPELCAVHGFGWAISYQDAILHTGNLYRHDGWIALARSRSGNDHRTGVKGRDKIVWGWHADEVVRAERRKAERKAEAERTAKRKVAA